MKSLHNLKTLIYRSNFVVHHPMTVLDILSRFLQHDLMRIGGLWANSPRIGESVIVKGIRILSSSMLSQVLACLVWFCAFMQGGQTASQEGCPEPRPGAQVLTHWWWLPGKVWKKQSCCTSHTYKCYLFSPFNTCCSPTVPPSIKYTVCWTPLVAGLIQFICWVKPANVLSSPVGEAPVLSALGLICSPFHLPPLCSQSFCTYCSVWFLQHTSLSALKCLWWLLPHKDAASPPVFTAHPLTPKCHLLLGVYTDHPPST